MLELVLVLTAGVGEGLTFVLGATLGLEMGIWFRLERVLELALVLGCELGIEAGCMLGLLVGMGTAGLGLVSDSFTVAVAGTSVLWELL